MKPILVFQTDFTYKEGAVCAMYGVVKSVDRELEIIDGTHEIPQYDIWSASYRLVQSMHFWPEGTIFVSVVDPGVGTPRKACVAKTAHGYFVVTPDNGSLTHLKAWVGISEVREIDQSVNRLRGKGTEGTSVFHGRDLFGYCAARLASGIITYEGVGPAYPVDEIVTLPIVEPSLQDGKVRGIFEIGDPNFGNLWTNIPLNLFTQAGFAYGDTLRLTVRREGNVEYQANVPFQPSFGYAPKGEVVIYNNELMRVSVAVNQGSFSERTHLSYGPEWQVEFEKVK
ncbi:DNA-directed RNA polymerase subunit delta [Ornatilinea apprima]|uniref:DNA-directed RNA polymerase subunit delta n=1 Tax=Ornatilinea apprima TaxID=1134406 RepID=A0A0P6XL16_9CHLR|nr:SAM-dependent chlorinase/fluorinase [Ornatilinea apprima]KPL76879.1 DNA-directed RNA polymerase subunit delta [Ornatilinea apprima]